MKSFLSLALGTVLFALSVFAEDEPLRVLTVGEAVPPATREHFGNIVREKGRTVELVSASAADWQRRQGPWDMVALVPPAEVFKTRDGLEAWGGKLLDDLRKAFPSALFLCRQPPSRNLDDIAAYDTLSRNCMFFTIGHDIGTIPAGFAAQCYAQERREGCEGFGGYGGIEDCGFEGREVPPEYIDACVWAEKICEVNVRNLAYRPEGEYDDDDLDLARRCAREAVRIFSPIPVRDCKLEAIGRMTPMAVEDEWWKRRLAEKQKEIAASGGSIDLVFVGSSQIHIWEGRCPRQLRDIKRDFTLLNLGYSGDSFQKVCWRLTKGHELDGYKAKCIMLVQGGNNTWETSSAVALGIKQILDVFAVKQPQAKVLLLPVNPRREWDCGTAPWPWAKTERANERLRHYADGKNVIWVDFREELLDDNDDTAWCMPKDRLHLGTEGLKIWYSHISPLFHEICGKPVPPETAGWIDRTPLVRQYKPNPYIWAARFEKRGGFVLEKRAGAEGKVEFKDGRVMIHKTNGRGSLLLKAHPFASHTNVNLRLYADVEVAESEHAQSFGGLAADGFAVSQAEEDLDARPAGCTIRRYCEGASTNGDVRPVIVVSGEPSKTYWSNWRAEEGMNPRRSQRVETVREMPLPETLKPDAVRRDVAVVTGASGKDVDRQLRTLEGASLIYSRYGLSQVRADPSLLEKARLVVLVGVADNAASFAAPGRMVVRTDKEDSFLTAEKFNRLARDSKAYVPTDETGLRLAIDGDIMEVECYCSGRYEVRLPAPYDAAVNMKSGVAESVANGELRLNLVAGGIYRFKMSESK